MFMLKNFINQSNLKILLFSVNMTSKAFIHIFRQVTYLPQSSLKLKRCMSKINNYFCLILFYWHMFSSEEHFQRIMHIFLYSRLSTLRKNILIVTVHYSLRILVLCATVQIAKKILIIIRKIIIIISLVLFKINTEGYLLYQVLCMQEFILLLITLCYKWG